MSNLEDLDKKLQIVEEPRVQEKEKPSTSSMSGDRPQRRGGRRPGRRGGKMDERAKLERSRQSARECRARKKLRYQYLEDLVANREKAVFALRDELELYKQWCIQMDKGLLPLALLKLCDEQMEAEKKMVPDDVSSDCEKPMDVTEIKGSNSASQQVIKGDNSNSTTTSQSGPAGSAINRNDSSKFRNQPSTSQRSESNSDKSQSKQRCIGLDSSEKYTKAIPQLSLSFPVASGSKEREPDMASHTDSGLAVGSLGASNFEFGTLDGNLKDVSEDTSEYDVLETLFDSMDEEVDLEDMESVRKFLMKQMKAKKSELPTIVEENEV